MVTLQASQIIGGNTAVGSTGFANVSGLSITLTTGADNVRISGSLGAYNRNTSADNFLYARILVDGVVQTAKLDMLTPGVGVEAPKRLHDLYFLVANAVGIEIDRRFHRDEAKELE